MLNLIAYMAVYPCYRLNERLPSYSGSSKERIFDGYNQSSRPRCFHPRSVSRAGCSIHDDLCPRIVSTSSYGIGS
jgi:hypothetical protein